MEEERLIEVLTPIACYMKTQSLVFSMIGIPEKCTMLIPVSQELEEDPHLRNYAVNMLLDLYVNLFVRIFSMWRLN